MADNLLTGVFGLLLVATLGSVLFLVDSATFKYFFFSSVSMIGGIVLASYAAKRMKLGKHSHSWPRTTGTVTKARIKQLRLVDINNPEDGIRIFFVPDIEYSYNVKDRTYNSKKISLDSKQYQSQDKTAVETILNRYASGTQVPVYYEPQNPDLSILERGYTKKRAENYLVLLLEGFILVAFGIGILVFKYSIYA